MSRTWRGSERKRRGRKWVASGRAAHNLGEQTEDRVEIVLQKLVDDTLIDSFVRHPPATPCKDFSVVKDGVRRDINVTASFRAYSDHLRFAPEVEAMYLPLSMSDQEIARRILRAFPA